MAVSFATRNLISRSRVSRCLGLRSTILSSRQMSTETMPLPNADPTAKKTYPEKISTIVEQIAKLNLLEVADLNELLKVSSKFDFLSGTIDFSSSHSKVYSVIDSEIKTNQNAEAANTIFPSNRCAIITRY